MISQPTFSNQNHFLLAELTLNLILPLFSSLRVKYFRPITHSKIQTLGFYIYTNIYNYFCAAADLASSFQFDNQLIFM